MIWFGIHFYTCKIWFYTCNCWFYTCKFIILGFLLINVTCNLFFQYWQAETIHNQLWLVSENHFYTCKIWFYTCKSWFYTFKFIICVFHPGPCPDPSGSVRVRTYWSKMQFAIRMETRPCIKLWPIDKILAPR